MIFPDNLLTSEKTTTSEPITLLNY